jgi:hypothetical protein
MIHVLWFDQRFEAVLKNFGEVILKLRATEILEDFFPSRRVL